MEWWLWPSGTGSGRHRIQASAAVPQLLLFPLPDPLHPLSGGSPLFLPLSVPPGGLRCTASVHRLPSACLSLFSGSFSVCFYPKTPSESICLAGQTLGSGPRSRARLLTAALGQGSKSALPSCGQRSGWHGGASPWWGGRGSACVGGTWQAGSSPRCWALLVPPGEYSSQAADKADPSCRRLSGCFVPGPQRDPGSNFAAFDKPQAQSWEARRREQPGIPQTSSFFGQRSMSFSAPPNIIPFDFCHCSFQGNLILKQNNNNKKHVF